MEPALAKIADDDLRQLAAEGQRGVRSVIVQVDVPRRRAKVKRSSENAGRLKIYGMAPATKAEESEAETAVAAVKTLLEQVATTPPVWLDASSAFVARVDPRRLLEIARSPAVRSIYPNTLRS